MTLANLYSLSTEVYVMWCQKAINTCDRVYVCNSTVLGNTTSLIHFGDRKKFNLFCIFLFGERTGAWWSINIQTHNNFGFSNCIKAVTTVPQLKPISFYNSNWPVLNAAGLLTIPWQAREEENERSYTLSCLQQMKWWWINIEPLFREVALHWDCAGQT